MSKKPTAEELVEELLAIEDVQARIDRVAEDFASGRDRYAAIDSWMLGELLGLDWEFQSGWEGRSCRVTKQEIKYEGYDYPFAENVELLEGKVPEARYRKLEKEAGSILEGSGKSDLALTEREEELLEDAWNEQRADGRSPDYEIVTTSLVSSSGTKLDFEVDQYDGPMVDDARTPYELRDGKGHDPTGSIEV